MAELFSGLHSAEWWQAPLGLWLPSSVDLSTPPPPREVRYQQLLIAERTNPLPGMAAFATLEVTGHEELDLEELQAVLGSLPRENWLRTISELQARLWAIDVGGEKHFELAREVYGETKFWPDLRRFLRAGSGDRVCFSEQGLTLLQWLVVAGASDESARALSEDERALMRLGLLGVASHIDVKASRTAGGDPGVWLYYLTQNSTFNAKPEICNAIGRTWTIYGQLAAELGPGEVPSHAPVAEWFAKDYELDLTQQLAIGFGLHAHLGVAGGDEHGGRHPIVVERELLEDLYERLGLSAKQRKKAHDLISAPLAWFQRQVGSQTLSRASWDQVPMMQRPLLRLEEDRYLLLGPRGLESWFSEGVYYRGLDCARSRGDKAVSDYTAYIGHLTEAYALGLAESVHSHPRLPGAGVVYGDENFGTGTHSSDITITYPNELAVVEVSSRRLTLESRCDGDRASLEFDLGEIAGRRVGQLERSITAIKPTNGNSAPQLRYPRTEPSELARIWPLIVTAVPLVWTPQLGEYLEAENPGALRRPDTEPLDILALEDFEILLGISERSGRRLVDLLRAKQEAAGPHTDVRRWLSSDRTAPSPARPRRLNEAFDEAMDRVLEALNFEPDDSQELAS